MIQRYAQFWFFYIRTGEYLLHHILCMIFKQKCLSCYILLTDQLSLPGCLYFLRYWVICVWQLFVIQVLTSWILKLLSWSFSLSCFYYMTKNSRQILKYFEKEKSFYPSTPTQNNPHSLKIMPQQPSLTQSMVQ